MIHKFHVPWPPSVNRIWRRGRTGMYRDGKYMAWRKAAMWEVATQIKIGTIIGHFRTEIILHPPDQRHRDIDNSVKVILDLVEALKLVENDRFCTQLVVSLDKSSTIPVGASVTLTAMSP